MEHRIGLIGCGGIAGTWTQAVAQHPDCRILLTFDLDPAAAARRAAEAGARPARDLDELLAAGEVDLVIIATPTPSHPELAARAARAGKHVLCEKPMALSLEQCQGMVDDCRSAGVELAIGHSLRFWGAFLTCRRLVAEGAIGVPVSGSIDRLGAAGLQRRAPAGAAPANPHWRSQVSDSGGLVLEGFVHEIDFTRAIFGEVAGVSCRIAGEQEYEGVLSPQIVQALVEFESGALVTMRTGGTVAMPTMGYWMAGTEGGLRFTQWGGPVEHYRHDLSEKRLVSCASTSAYYLELCDLLKAVEQGGELENSPLNGKKNVALGLGMYRACETGRHLRYSQGLPVEMAADYRNTRW